MNKIKLDHFRTNNPGKEFPEYSSLSSHDTNFIRKTLRKALSIDSRITDLEFTILVDKMQTVVPECNALRDNFDLRDVFNACCIHPHNKVYINWYRYDDIDELDLEDFIKHFDDIWYPHSDDIDIFDSAFSWIVSVSHNGIIKFLDITKVKDVRF